VQGFRFAAPLASEDFVAFALRQRVAVIRDGPIKVASGAAPAATP